MKASRRRSERAAVVDARRLKTKLPRSTAAILWIGGVLQDREASSAGCKLIVTPAMVLSCEPHTETAANLVEPIDDGGDFQVDDKGEFVAHRILNSNSTSGTTLSLDLNPSYT